MPTTPHAATAYPEEDLYIKSPEETRDLYLAEIEEMRAAHARENRTVAEQYEKLTGLDTTRASEQTAEDPPPADPPPADPASEAPAAP